MFGLASRVFGLALGAGCDPRDPALGGGGTPNEHTGPGNVVDPDTSEPDSGEDSAVDTASLEGTGYQAGDVAFDLQGVTDHGGAWSLYEQAGDPIVLVVGDMDNSAMVQTLSALPDVDEAWPHALMVAMVGRDEYSVAADAADGARWRLDYGLEVVLIDPSVSDMSLWSDNNPPKTYVIGPDLVIDWVAYGIAGADQISAAIQG